MIPKKPMKYSFEDSDLLFQRREETVLSHKDIDIAINRLFDIGLNKAMQSPRPLVQKSIRLYRIMDDYIACSIVKYDYFCNTIRGHLKIYNGENDCTYIKTNDMFYDTGYRSKKEIDSLKSYYEKKKGVPENNGID